MSINPTLIEWAKNPDGTQGYTLNPIKGKCPIACPYCYARKMYDRFKWNPEPRFEEDVLNDVRRKLYRADKSLGIFMCSTFEWLWDEEWAWNILRFCAKFPQHRFYLLTKQPQNLIKFSPFPDHCYVGVSATNATQTTLAQHYLSLIDARVKYISFEPLLSYITKTRFHFKGLGTKIHWVIIGAQTKPYKPPEIEWVEEIVRACDKAGVSVFLKDNLYPLIHKEALVRHRGLFMSEYGLRQEVL